MLVRPRETPDEAACVDLLTRVHTHDGYPRHLPGWPAAFLFAGHETTAWVCEIDGQITGHLALHAAASDPALDSPSERPACPPMA